MCLMIRTTVSAIFTLVLMVASSHAAVVSFLVDPATIDGSPPDGFITGTEFSPIGSDGTAFVLTPTDNLVGGDRFLLSPTNGLSFGGGSGSTLSFDFTPNANIQLESYTIGGGLSVNNPIFDIREGATVLSMSNDGDTSGSFAGGPIALQGGTTYNFIVTTPGAAFQRQMASWNYSLTAVPEPSSCGVLAFLAGVAVIQRRRRC